MKKVFVVIALLAAAGLTPLARFFSGTFFTPVKTLRIFFAANKKLSFTAGALCAIALRL